MLFALLGSGVLLILLLSPQILIGVGLQLMGVQRIGTTGDVFDNADSPIVQYSLQNSRPVDRFTVTIPGYGQETFNQADFNIAAGEVATGVVTAAVTITEADFERLCHNQPQRCNREAFDDLEVDFRPGGVIIYADVQAALGQKIGIAVTIVDAGRTIEVAGVDIGGALYDVNSLPDDLKRIVQEARQIVDQSIDTMTVTIGGQALRLYDINSDHEQIRLVFQ